MDYLTTARTTMEIEQIIISQHSLKLFERSDYCCYYDQYICPL